LVPITGGFIAILSLLAFALIRQQMRFILIFCVIGFLTFSIVGFKSIVAGDHGLPARQAAETIKKLIPKGTDHISYNLADYSYSTFYFMQFWLRDLRFEAYLISEGRQPKFPVFLSKDRPEFNGLNYSAHRVGGFDVLLWIPKDKANINVGEDIVNITSSQFNAINPPTKIFDNKNDTWADSWISAPLDTKQPYAWVEIYHTEPILCNEYSITASNHHPIRYPSSWVLSGSNDRKQWQQLSSMQKQSFTKGEKKVFPCDGRNAKYAYLRLEFTGMESGQDRVTVGEMTIN
jgi:hypothetical protein